MKKLLGSDRDPVHYGIDTKDVDHVGKWGKHARARNLVALQLVDKEINCSLIRGSINAPKLDVGSGNSLMRTMLKHVYGEILNFSHDLDNKPYPHDKKYKYIFHFELIEHLLNPLFHLRELRKICRPDGHLFMGTPNDYSLFYKLQHLLSMKHLTHFHQFNLRELRTLLELAGWKVVTIKKYHRPDSGILSRFSRNGLFVHAIPG